jgi:uncharacterized membrane protein YfcA
MLYEIALIFASVLAGGMACISGFGIGSLLTPIIAVKAGTGIAVAAVSVAHFLGTFLRFWIWKKHINRKVLLSFGIMSAAGGLAGAWLHNVFQNDILTAVFGSLLIFAGFSGVTGMSEKWKLSGAAAWIAGSLSGFFGGLVGNQGGIRSAAMLGFDMKGKEFVATATGIALVIDMTRMPIYFFSQGKQILELWPLILISSIGVLIGTEIGIWTLGKIPEALFKKIVSGIIFCIGIGILIQLM